MRIRVHKMAVLSALLGILTDASPAAGPQAEGIIAYDAGQNRITVSGFPEEAPVTLMDVFDADQEKGWSRMRFEAGSQTFSLDASLWIGSREDYGTFFQIGVPERPNETLVLSGDLVVTPPRPTGARVEHWSDYAGERYDGAYRVSNRLTVGDPNDPSIRASIRIASSRKDEFSVMVQSDPPPEDPAERWYFPMGEIHLHNAILTSDTPHRNHTYTAEIHLAHLGGNYHLENSEISWWSGDLFRTVIVRMREQGPEARTARNMVFRNGGNASGPFAAVDCEFRHLETARTNRGAVRGMFSNNRNNIMLTPAHTGITLLDCELGESANPLLVPKSGRDEAWLRNYSVHKNSSYSELVLNPGVVEQKSVVVKVIDPDEQPVFGVAVIISNPDDLENLGVEVPLAVTGEDGLTPAGGSGDAALIVTTRELRPTDDPAAPREVTFVYRLRAEASGYEPVEIPLDTARKIPNPVLMQFKKRSSTE